MISEYQTVTLSKDDLTRAQRLFATLNTVFEKKQEPLAEEQLSGMLAHQGFIAMAALDGEQVLGGLIAFILPLYTSQGAEVFLYDIGVLPQYQRKGIGKRLLDSLAEHCRQKGITHFFVPAHEEDQEALEFYTATGGEAQKTVHFTYTVA